MTGTTSRPDPPIPAGFGPYDAMGQRPAGDPWAGVQPLSAEQQNKWAAAGERIAAGTGPFDGLVQTPPLRYPGNAYRLAEYRGKHYLQHAPINLDGSIAEDEWVDVDEWFTDERSGDEGKECREALGRLLARIDGNAEPRAAGWQP